MVSPPLTRRFAAPVRERRWSRHTKRQWHGPRKRLDTATGGTETEGSYGHWGAHLRGCAPHFFGLDRPRTVTDEQAEPERNTARCPRPGSGWCCGGQRRIRRTEITVGDRKSIARLPAVATPPSRRRGITGGYFLQAHFVRWPRRSGAGRLPLPHRKQVRRRAARPMIRPSSATQPAAHPEGHGFTSFRISAGRSGMIGAGLIRASRMVPNTPQSGHVNVIALPLVFASIAFRESSIVKPHRAAQPTSSAFRGGTSRCGPFGPSFFLFGLFFEPFRTDASIFANDLERPPSADFFRKYSANSGLRRCLGRPMC